MFGARRASDRTMNTQPSRAQALQQRLICHAAVLLGISSKLPPTSQATHVSRQLLRSGTAAAANYGEARGAESRSDFIHKLRIVLKELNETDVWLRLIVESSLLSPEKMSGIVAKNDELCRIIRHLLERPEGLKGTESDSSKTVQACRQDPSTIAVIHSGPAVPDKRTVD